MGKLRGQTLIVGLIMFMLAFLIAYAFLPVLGEGANTAVTNTTLFPRNGPAYLIAGLGPAIFILVPIIGMIMFIGGGGQRQ
jgi:hypothetical protein